MALFQVLKNLSLAVVVTSHLMITDAFAKVETCEDLLSSDSKLISAIQNGIRIFDLYENAKGVEGFLSFQTQMFIHGTSFESLKRDLESKNLTGSPTEKFTRLDGLVQKSEGRVLYTYELGNSLPLNEIAASGARWYAEGSAQQYYVESWFPEKYRGRDLARDLIYSAEQNGTLSGFVELEISPDEIDPLNPNRHTDIRWFKHRFKTQDKQQIFEGIMNRRGLILILKPEITQYARKIADPEADEGYAMVFEHSIPIDLIQFVIPMAETDREELKKLLEIDLNR